MTTASMISAPRTGLGSCEKSGARNSRVNRTVTPLVIDASPVLAPEWSLRELADRLVELEIVDSISHQGVANVLKKTTSSRGNSTTGASGR